MVVATPVEGTTSFTFSLPDEPEFKVMVKFATGNSGDNKLFPNIVSSPTFTQWLDLYCKPKSLQLHGITVKSLQMNNNKEIRAMHMDVDASYKDGCQVPGSVYLQGASVAILVLLRNTDTGRDMCVFVQQPRPALGSAEFLVIPEGQFDENGKVVGPAAELMEQDLALTLSRNDLICLTSLAFGKDCIGVCCGKETDERVTLYLYRANVSSERMKELEAKISEQTKEKEKDDEAPAINGAVSTTERGIKLRLVALGGAWRATTDSKTINALFLVHELRYHGLMPKYRPPNNSSYAVGGARRDAPPLEKKSAKFLKVKELAPATSGVNLRLKVARPINLEPERVRKDGRRIKEGTLVAGDEGGLITLKLSEDQLNIKDTVGAPLVIRNGKIQMEDGHMKLAVDQWGKLSTDIPAEELVDFEFLVSYEVDMSATEYELVELPENDNDSENNTTSPEHTVTASKRGNGSAARRSRFGGGGGRGASVGGPGGRRSNRSSRR